MENRDRIEFRPINKGLGFHPFADGLPYTPPATPSAPATVRHQPRAAQVSHATPPPSVEPRILASMPSPAPVRPAPSLGMSYVFRRTAAFIVDTGLNTVLCALALGLTVWRVQGDLTPFFSNRELQALTIVFLFAFSWALTTAQEIAFGTSIGKRMVGLRLEGSVIALFLRAFFFWVSLGFFGIGLLWAVFSRQRRCWHDAVVDIQPL